MDLIGLARLRPRCSFRPASRWHALPRRSSERVNIAAGAAPLATWTICSGCVSTRAVGDLDHDAVGHHRGSSAPPSDRTLSGVETAAPCSAAVAGRLQHLAQRADAEALLETAEVGQLRREHAIDQHQPAHALDRVQLQRRLPRASAPPASGAGASGSTSRISTRRSVYFQSSIRRCGRPARS